MPEPDNSKKRVLIVDDHPILREGLESALRMEPDLEVCGEASTVQEALNRVEATRPDLVVTDLSLPDRNGLELIKDLKALYRDLPVLVVSMHNENVYAERALQAGARGYIMKEAALDRIADAIRQVLNGELYVSEALMKRLLQTIARGADETASPPLKRLTDRELEVFRLIGLQKNSREIAEFLSISRRTVNAHRSHIRQKLNLRDGGALLIEATKWIESKGNQ